MPGSRLPTAADRHNLPTPRGCPGWATTRPCRQRPRQAASIRKYERVVRPSPHPARPGVRPTSGRSRNHPKYGLDPTTIPGSRAPKVDSEDLRPCKPHPQYRWKFAAILRDSRIVSIRRFRTIHEPWFPIAAKHPKGREVVPSPPGQAPRHEATRLRQRRLRATFRRLRPLTAKRRAEHACRREASVVAPRQAVRRDRPELQPPAETVRPSQRFQKGTARQPQESARQRIRIRARTTNSPAPRETRIAPRACRRPARTPAAAAIRSPSCDHLEYHVAVDVSERLHPHCATVPDQLLRLLVVPYLTRPSQEDKIARSNELRARQGAGNGIVGHQQRQRMIRGAPSRVRFVAKDEDALGRVTNSALHGGRKRIDVGVRTSSPEFFDGSSTELLHRRAILRQQIQLPACIQAHPAYDNDGDDYESGCGSWRTNTGRRQQTQADRNRHEQNRRNGSVARADYCEIDRLPVPRSECCPVADLLGQTISDGVLSSVDAADQDNVSGIAAQCYGKSN